MYLYYHLVETDLLRMMHHSDCLQVRFQTHLLCVLSCAATIACSAHKRCEAISESELKTFAFSVNKLKNANNQLSIKQDIK